jgi:Flp pilus assembly protein TadG
MPAAPAASSCARQRGQALVEFAAVLLPALLIVVGIIQFGLIFGANVTLTNAAREAARAATIARYDVSPGITRADNDLDRCTAALDAARNSFGLMNAATPNFTVTRPCPVGSATDLNGDGFADRWVNGDMTITLCASMATPTSACPTTGTYCAYDDPSGPPAGDPCLVQITLAYRSDIVVPLIGDLIGRDSGGRFVHTARATMAVN